MLDIAPGHHEAALLADGNHGYVVDFQNVGAVVAGRVDRLSIGPGVAERFRMLRDRVLRMLQQRSAFGGRFKRSAKAQDFTTERSAGGQQVE